MIFLFRSGDPVLLLDIISIGEAFPLVVRIKKVDPQKLLPVQKKHPFFTVNKNSGCIMKWYFNLKLRAFAW